MRLVGRITDATTGAPLPDAMITVTSPALAGEEIVVSDREGAYRFGALPVGTYVVRVDQEHYRDGVREYLVLRPGRTVRFDVALWPDADGGEVILACGPPTIDVGNSSLELELGEWSFNRLPVVRPDSSGSAGRWWDSLIGFAPGVNEVPGGFSVAGGRVSENRFQVDGISVNDGSGRLGMQVPLAFVESNGVQTGGLPAEFGGVLGGVARAATRYGSNEFHGALFANGSLAALNASAPTVVSAASSIAVTDHPSNRADVGFTVGGTIQVDRLWFEPGYDPAVDQVEVTRRFDRFIDCNGDGTIDGRDLDRHGLCRGALPGKTTPFLAQTQSHPYLARLTWLINGDHVFTLSELGSRTASGSDRTLGIDPHDGRVDSIAAGAFDAIAHRYQANANALSLKYQGSFFDRRLLFDADLGWYHQDDGVLPADGAITSGVAAQPGRLDRRTAGGPHLLRDYFDLAGDALRACDDTGLAPTSRPRCPVSTFATGGPGELETTGFDRYQSHLVGTLLLSALGHHVIKAGVEGGLLRFEHHRRLSGDSLAWESTNGDSFSDLGALARIDATARGLELGAFVQDSWSILDVVTVNAGLRDDVQQVLGASGIQGVTLTDGPSPRIGVVYDVSQEGHSKVFAHYGRLTQTVPLQQFERPFSASGPVAVIDPRLRPPATNEVVAGASYEVIPEGVLSASYIHRSADQSIALVSTDDANTLAIVNPGGGLGQNFPKTRRNYDAVNVSLDKLWADRFLFRLSYTWSSLRGNVTGIGDGSEVGLLSLASNRVVPLPTDRTHTIQAYAAKEFELSASTNLNVALVYRGVSGTPVQALGANPVLGPRMVAILPSGSEGRTPWVHSVDARLAMSYAVAKAQRFEVSVEAFNLFDFGAATAVDQTLTVANASPAPAGTTAQQAIALAGSALNPNFKNPTAYQAPRTVRIGLRLSF